MQVVDNWANFQQYGLSPPVGLLRADAHFPPFRECSRGFLDAIVCDPPYGVRAGGRRSISAAENGVLSKAGHQGLEVRGATGKSRLQSVTSSFSRPAGRNCLVIGSQQATVL